MSAIHDKSFLEFEALGEAEVRRRLNCSELHIMQQEPALSWLAINEAKAKTRAEEREDKVLALTQEANDIANKARADARKANIIAICSILISVTTAAIIAWYTVKNGN